MSTAAPATVRRSQHLLFAVGELRCSLELTRLDAIVPWVTLRHMESQGWLGWMDYRGEAVPVADCEQILFGSATERYLGSRILLLRCGGRRVGVLVRDAVSIAHAADLDGTEVERFDPCDVLASMLSGLPA